MGCAEAILLAQVQIDLFWQLRVILRQGGKCLKETSLWDAEEAAAALLHYLCTDLGRTGLKTS